jgi:hypothetical protein
MAGVTGLKRELGLLSTLLLLWQLNLQVLLISRVLTAIGAAIGLREKEGSPVVSRAG